MCGSQGSQPDEYADCDPRPAIPACERDFIARFDSNSVDVETPKACFDRHDNKGLH